MNIYHSKNRITITLLLLLCYAILPSASYAQAPTAIASCMQQELVWQKKFHYDVGNMVNAMHVDAQGNRFVVGSYGFPLQLTEDKVLDKVEGGSFPFIIKYDQQNNIDFAIGASNATWISQFHDVHVDQQGDIYISGVLKRAQVVFGGASLISREAGDDLIIYKLTPTGKIIWVRKFNQLANRFKSAVAADEEGNTYVLGKSVDAMELDGHSIQADSYFIVKIGTDNKVIWAREVAPTSTIKNDAAGNLYLLSGTPPSTKLDRRSIPSFLSPRVAKMNKQGEIVWEKTFSNSNIRLSDLQVINNGGILVSGFSNESTIQLDNYPFSTDQSVQSFYLNIDVNGSITEAQQLEGIAIKKINQDQAGRKSIVYAATAKYPELFDEYPHFLASLNQEDEVVGKVNLDYDTPQDMSTDMDGFTYVVGTDDPYCSNNCIVTNGKMFFSKFEKHPIEGLVDIGMDRVLCANESITLTANVEHRSYSWNTGATTPSIEVSTPGWYALTVTNDIGCQGIDSVFVADPAPLSIDEVQVKEVACLVKDGAVSIQPTGTEPFSYQWSNGSTNKDLVEVGIGVYSLTLTDGNGCTVVQENIKVSQQADCEYPDIQLKVIGDQHCANESIQFQTNVIAATYKWDFGDGTSETNQQSSISHNFLNKGNYIVSVTAKFEDGSTLEATKEITVNSTMADFSYSFSGYTISLEADTENEESITDYTWDFGNGVTQTSTERSNTYTYKEEGMYPVTLTTTGVCTTSSTITKTIAVEAVIPENDLSLCRDGIDNDLDGLVDENDPDCDAALNGTIVCCENFCLRISSTNATEGNNDGKLLITLESFSGSPYYQVSYSGPALFDFYSTPESGFIGENMTPGTYQLTVTDYYNPDCSQTVEIVIKEASINHCEGLMLHIEIPTDPCEENKYQANITGGTAPFQYNWNQSGYTTNPTFIATNQDAGAQVLTVMDANGCTTTQSFEVIAEECFVDEDQDGYEAANDPDDTNPCVPDNTGIDCESDKNDEDTDEKDEDSDHPAFVQYPWLLDIIDPSNCTGTKVTRYPSGPFDFLLIETPESSALYLDGTYYCGHTANYDCVAAYNLSVESAEVLWSCASFNSVASSRMKFSTSSKQAIKNLDYELKVYPNPTVDRVRIQYAEQLQVEQVELFNLEGKLLQSIIPQQSNQTELSIGSYPAGIYIVKINGISSKALKVQKLD